MDAQSQKRLSVQTVGCRLNQYESEKMVAVLHRFGFRRVGRGEAADLYIINTCTVTHRADADNRYLIKKAARENPSAKIVVAGCYVDKDPANISGMEAVDAIISNRDKENIVEILRRRFPELLDRTQTDHYNDVVPSFSNHNRAWVKVSDGCNQKCAFCILPSVRGVLINRPAGEIIDEVNKMVSAGFCEIALTGFHLGSYEDSSNGNKVANLAAFCRLLLSETDLPRIRLSSIEPQTVTDELLQLCADSGDRICRHIHMPLQSGSDRLLKIMRRPYDTAGYLQRVRAVRKFLPKAIMGADVIVGFPGETDDDFDRACSLIEHSGLDYLHVFSYSDRPGTTAADLSGKVRPETTKMRNTALSRLSGKLRNQAYQRQVGETLGVIAENRKPAGEPFWGVADNYVKVQLPAHFEGGRRIVSVRVETACPDYVSGPIISN